MRYKEIIAINETTEESQETNLIARYAASYIQKTLDFYNINSKTRTFPKQAQKNIIFTKGTPLAKMGVPDPTNAVLKKGIRKIKVILMTRPDPEFPDALALYDPNTHTIGISLPMLLLRPESLLLRSVQTALVHEIRHYVDDIKSNSRNAGNRPEPKDKNEYLRQPHEVSARVQEAMREVHDYIQRADDPTIIDVMPAIKFAMSRHSLNNIYPKDSQQYKQIIKRLWLYAQEEIKNPKKVQSKPMLQKIAAWILGRPTTTVAE